LPWIDSPIQQEDRTVLFFGRLSRYKGLDVLYRAIPRVAEAIPNVYFIVAGQPSFGYRPPTPPAIPNGGRIEVLADHIGNARLAALFQLATIVVCPYRDATQSGVVLTSYAFGRPVVATRVGGLPEYVNDGETGLLVPPNDSKALAASLVKVLEDPALQTHLKEGVAAVERSGLNWKRTAADTLRVYSRASAR